MQLFKYKKSYLFDASDNLPLGSKNKAVKIFLILLCGVLIFANCSTSSRIYIVRHAEKDSIGQDPNLTAEGLQRAIDLADYMSNKKIRNIYSTNTNRTKQTAAPLSERKGMKIQVYVNDTLQKFLYRILESGNNALIVAHSNTSLRMLKELSLTPGIKTIPEDDYDNLFIVTLKSRSGPSGFNLKLKETTYGKKSPVPKD